MKILENNILIYVIFLKKWWIVRGFGDLFAMVF
jgi:hypothetical protein